MHLAGRSCLTIWEDYNPNWIKTKQTNDAFWWEMKTFFFSIFGFREKDALLGLCFVGFGNSSFYVYDIAGTLPFFYSYGDRIPKSIPSRLFAFIWTWVGIATTAVIMSSITAYLMNMVFQPARMLYGTRVSKLHVYSREITSFECFPKTEILTSIDLILSKFAAIANSKEYKLGLRRNAKLDPGKGLVFGCSKRGYC